MLKAQQQEAIGKATAIDHRILSATGPANEGKGFMQGSYRSWHVTASGWMRVISGGAVPAGNAD
jgi:hypothetical protein